MRNPSFVKRLTTKIKCKCLVYDQELKQEREGDILIPYFGKLNPEYVVKKAKEYMPQGVVLINVISYRLSRVLYGMASEEFFSNKNILSITDMDEVTLVNNEEEVQK